MNLSIDSLQSVVDRMRTVASSATGQTAGLRGLSASALTDKIADAGGDSGGFASALTDAVKSVNEAQATATKKTEDYMLGKPGVSLNDLMMDIQKAALGFQGTVQLRNKMTQAYQTIASMPV